MNDKRTNGNREILVRELPWLTETFGEVIDFKVEMNKTSSLELSYPDTYFLIVTHLSGAKGVILIDVVSRKSSINLEIISEDIYISWRGTPESLNDYDIINNKDSYVSVYKSFEQDERYSKNIIEDAYRNEIETFFAEVEGSTKSIYGFEKDKKNT